MRSRKRQVILSPERKVLLRRRSGPHNRPDVPPLCAFSLLGATLFAPYHNHLSDAVRDARSGSGAPLGCSLFLIYGVLLSSRRRVFFPNRSLFAASACGERPAGETIFVKGPRPNTGSDVSGTSPSLLVRAREQDPDAWGRLVSLYTPLVYGWCRRAGLTEMDAADVCQETFCKLVQLIGEFRHEPGRSTFRHWLRTITWNQLRSFARREERWPHGIGGNDALEILRQLPAKEDEEQEALVREHQLLCWRAAELVRRNVEDKTWSAFWRVTVEGEDPVRIAFDLGLTVNAVYIARWRVLKRLRGEFAGLIDFEAARDATGPPPQQDRPSPPEASDATGSFL